MDLEGRGDSRRASTLGVGRGCKAVLSLQVKSIPAEIASTLSQSRQAFTMRGKPVPKVPTSFFQPRDIRVTAASPAATVKSQEKDSERPGLGVILI